jgi:hypothetical protein
MADTETTDSTEQDRNGGNGNGHDTRRTAVRAAALAAAGSATAFAAKKALSGRGSSSDDDNDDRDEKPARRGDSMVGSMLSSGWESARDSVVPMLSDAAANAGEYVAKNAPEIVTDTIVPEFIRGFQGAKKTSSDDDEE